MVAFIAVVLVMGMMLFFMIITISKIISQINNQIFKDVQRSLDIYDPIFERKSLELREIEEKLAKKHQELDYQEEVDSGFDSLYLSNNVSVSMKNVKYINQNFFDDYKQVKNIYHDIAFEQMKEKVNLLIRSRRSFDIHEYREILDIFDYQLQYKMFTLAHNEQLEIIKVVASHSIAKKRILNRYIDAYDTFDFKKFMDYLRDYIFNNDSIIYIFSHSGERCLEDVPKNVVFKKDDSIGEGYIVKYRTQYFDYSL